MTWVRYANRLEEENNGLKKLLEEALDHIDQYDYEESFDLVQRIKDSLGSKPLKAVQWGDNAVTGAEELLQKVQQLERENAALRADAERYRWIKRDNIGVHDVLELFMSYINCDLDKEIDAARAKEAQP